jgi:hypothetical protein
MVPGEGEGIQKQCAVRQLAEKKLMESRCNYEATRLEQSRHCTFKLM